MTWGSSLIAGSVNRVVPTLQNGVEVLRFGGLQTGSRPSPFQTVERCDMYRLRHYFPESAAIVHIVDRIPLTPSYRPLSTTLRSAGLPASGQTTWYHDHTDGHYRQGAIIGGKPPPSSPTGRRV